MKEYYAKQHLCQEIYKLTQWEEERMDWYFGKSERIGKEGTKFSEPICPKYSLGFLLRKLQALGYFELAIRKKRWSAEAHPEDSPTLYETADTPEDSCAMLTLEVIQQGILNVRGGLT